MTIALSARALRRLAPGFRRQEIAEFRSELPRLFAAEAGCFDCACNRICGLGPCAAHREARKELAR